MEPHSQGTKKLLYPRLVQGERITTWTGYLDQVDRLSGPVAWKRRWHLADRNLAGISDLRAREPSCDVADASR